jgi:hypothetical protein
MVKGILGAPEWEGVSEETGKYILSYKINGHNLSFQSEDKDSKINIIGLY